MEFIGAFLLLVIGYLVMFRVIPTRSVGNWVAGVIFILIFGPVLLGIAKGDLAGIRTGDHPWWVYIVSIFVVLFVMRLIFEFIFPRRRR